MLSYTKLRNSYNDEVSGGTLTSSQLTVGDRRINSEIKVLLRSHAWPFLETTGTTATIASTQFYNYPANVGKYHGVSITIGSRTYVPSECVSKSDWDKLNEVAITADIPEWYFIFGGQVGFYPKPSTAGNTITHIYRKGFRDLSIADYTTGAIASITSGSTLVTGSASVWSASMAGRYISIAVTDAANSGDGEWYEIATSSTTTVVLVKNYMGASISGASQTYTIGEMAPIPDGYQEIPLYGACAIYFASIDENRANYYKNLKGELTTQLVADQGSKSDSVIVEDMDTSRDNPNNYVSL